MSGSENCVNRTRQQYDITHRVEACKKKQKACLKDLKCLNREPLVALSMRFNCRRVDFIESILLKSLLKAFDCISTISTFV